MDNSPAEIMQSGDDGVDDVKAEIRRQMRVEREAQDAKARKQAVVDAEIRREMAAWDEMQRGAPQRRSESQRSEEVATKRSFFDKWKSKGGILSLVATILLVGWKFFAPAVLLLGKLKFFFVALKALSFGKLFITGGSMLLSIVLQATLYGWPMAVGIVLMIFLHECGHAFAAHLRGKPIGAMVFIPFMGAFVTTRGGDDIEEDAFIGIMGPIVGGAFGVASVLLYALTGSPFWLALAAITFAINLFNLIPTAPLDGGWIAPLFSPKLLAVGALMLIPLALLNPMIGLLGLLSLPRIIGGWKADPATQPYYRVSNGVRWRYGLVYVGLALSLGLGMIGVWQEQDKLRQPVAAPPPVQVAMSVDFVRKENI